jgi:hypothetical protein
MVLSSQSMTLYLGLGLSRGYVNIRIGELSEMDPASHPVSAMSFVVFLFVLSFSIQMDFRFVPVPSFILI